MRILILAPLLVLAACSNEERTAGGATPNEARALEDAAEMVQDQRVPPDSVPSTAAAGALPQAKSTPSGKPAG